MQGFRDIANTITRITDESLRNYYKPEEYKKVILPMTVLRRLDCVLEGTKEAVLEEFKKFQDPMNLTVPQKKKLERLSGNKFYNTSNFTFETLISNGEADLAANFRKYIDGFSDNAKKIIQNFKFEDNITRLEEGNLLYLVLKRFSEVDLHPNKVTNMDMGYAFEELIRRFSENAEAGDHYTPREVINLMIRLLFAYDKNHLLQKGIIRSIYDPTAGTGGMLASGLEHLHKLNPNAKLNIYGQEINPESYAIALADILIRGLDTQNIQQGDTLVEDKLANEKFDYVIANPPYGVNWSKSKKAVEDEHKKLGMDGRYGPGLPRTSDGSLLFVLHMLSKLKDNGGRLAVVLSGSPLFTGAAGSGESEIRKHLFENDLVEAIIGLPNDLFFNTGINTYVWVISNKKPKERKGKIQLIDARNKYVKMKKSLGNKRNELTKEHIEELTNLYVDFVETKESKIYNNEYFGYKRITVERPLKVVYKKDEEKLKELKETLNLEDSVFAEIENKLKVNEFNYQEFSKFLTKELKLKKTDKDKVLNILMDKSEEYPLALDEKGNKVVDSELRDNENVPLNEKIDEYMDREVLPHVPDAWVDEDKTKVGYEIPFTREFYEYVPLRLSKDIKKEILSLEKEISELMEGLFDEEV